MTRGLAQLDPLVGEWTSSSGTYPDARGRLSVARTEGGEFLCLEAAMEDPRFPRTRQHIGADDGREECTVLYFDSRGVHRVYQTTLVAGEWKIWREAPGFNQRFIGRIEEGGRKIDGRWEMSEDGEHWKIDFDLTYTKVA